MNLYEWHKMIQIAVDEIDGRIKRSDDDALTLKSLSKKLGFSEFHTTRKFKELSGMSLRDYIRLRKLAFALIEVRDSDAIFLSIAIKYGFSSHEAFTRAFKKVYGIAPSDYRKNPQPVVLRTKINTFDRFTLGIGEIGMVKSTEEIKVYFVTIPAHKFLHIKNYESNGYFDFWEKQAKIPGQDCDTICGLLDSIKGKLDACDCCTPPCCCEDCNSTDNNDDCCCNDCSCDSTDSKDNVVGEYKGQIMGYIYEAGGKKAEAYGVRLPKNYSGAIPKNMLVIDIPEKEYIVFEHGPFNFELESKAVGEKLEEAMKAFDFSKTDYKTDESTGRISYFYFIPESFQKRILPVKKS